MIIIAEFAKQQPPNHNTDYSGTPAHPGHSSAQPDRTSAHLM